MALTQSLEIERLGALANSFLARYTAAERARVPVHITTMARHSSCGRATQLSRARKRYLGFDLFVTGWMLTSEYGAQLTNTRAVVTDHDYKGVERAQVLGIVEVAGRAIWVMETRGYESEAYVLTDFGALEAAPRTVRISAGGC